MRSVLPSEVRALLDRVQIRSGETAGLDLFPAGRGGEDEVVVFPQPSPGAALVFGDSADAEAGIAAQPEPDSVGIAPLSLGACVATHNPGLINVNTAPIDLVEAAMRSAGRGGLEAIIEARAAGKPASLASSPGDDRRGSRSRLGLTTTSTVWAFRIDARVGPIVRSWWAVYERGGRGPKEWRCVQRLAITD